MTQRNGSSLVEVLVAIFVMGLGLIALLTLFPIGMLRMALAIHHDKCALSSQIAHANSITHATRFDLAMLSDPGPPAIPDMFVNPNPVGPPAFVSAHPFGESYAVLVDPIGYNSAPLVSKDWVGGTAVLRRRSVGFVTTPVGLYKSFTLWDDIKFEKSFDPLLMPPGTPYKLTAATNLFRDVRYSWAYLLRRPQTSDPAVVDCTVVVYDGRDPLLMPEYVYSTSYYDTARNSITIDYTNNFPPPVRPGNWLLDATVWYFNPANPNVYNAAGTAASQHAYFYRVVAVEEIVIPGPPPRTLVRYEVAAPLRGLSGPPGPSHFPAVVDPTNPTGPAVFQGTTIVLDGVAEVYEKGPGRLP